MPAEASTPGSAHSSLPSADWTLLATLSTFNRGYLQRLLSDVRDDELDLQPQPAVHSIRWILAHLAIVSDYGGMLLGLPRLCPAEWHAAYGPASQPGTAADVRPGRQELLQAIDAGYSRLASQLPQTPPDRLAALHTVTLLQDTPLKTNADLAAHILITHFAMHAGQLSVLRRLLGRLPLF